MKKTNEKIKVKSKEKSFLMIIAGVLYLLAIINLIVGIVQMSSHFSSVTEKFFDLDDDLFESMFFDGKLQSAISSLFSAFVFFIWGSVFMFIANSRLMKHKMQKKQEELERLNRERAEETAQVKEPEVQKERYFCAYCDNELGEDDRKCPYCGSSKKIKK